MSDYNKGKIYTIRCRTDETLIYVGSTIQPLCERFAGHKRGSKIEKNKNMLIYQNIKDDWDNWYIELYELYPCSSKEELCRREGEIIRLIGTLNKNIAGRSQKEQREKKIEYKKKYDEANKEKQAEQNKAYYEANKEKKTEQHKAYYEANKEKMLEYQKQYRQKKKQNKNNPL